MNEYRVELCFRISGVTSVNVQAKARQTNCITGGSDGSSADSPIR